MASNLTQRRAPGSVEPFVSLNPAPVTQSKVAPTTTNYMEPSTIWIQPTDTTGAPVNNIWILASTQNAVANWVQVGSGGGSFGSFNNIFLPDTPAGGAVGVIYFGGQRFIHDFDDTVTGQSVYVGKDAGNFTGGSGNVGIGYLALASSTGSNGFNSAVGYQAGTSITTGEFCTLVGASAGTGLTTSLRSTVVGCQSMTVETTGNDNTVVGAITAQELTGSNNVIVGSQAALTLVAGNSNIIIGHSAGNAYTTSESTNILIGNPGTIGDDFTIRIGTFGTHTEAFIAGDTTVNGNVFALSFTAVSDPGSGTAGTTTISNGINTTQSTGTLSIKSNSANPGNNAGFIKTYVNGSTAWIPYFTNINP